MASVHNPSKFEPSDYEVNDYFDNRPPEYCLGMNAEQHRKMLEFHHKDRMRLFKGGACYQCSHCGNGNVRYVVSVLHIPTGDLVCFGSDCVHRLGFKDRMAFKEAELRAKAELNHKKVLVYMKYQAFLKAAPEMASFLEEVKKPVHARNSFVHDLASKLMEFGSLSARQVEAGLASLRKDERSAADALKPKGPAPEGRVQVVAKVLGAKYYENGFGETFKMTAELPNGSRVFCTVPSALLIKMNEFPKKQGLHVRFTATFTPKKEDPSFAFGLRPAQGGDVLEIPPSGPSAAEWEARAREEAAKEREAVRSLRLAADAVAEKIAEMRAQNDPPDAVAQGEKVLSNLQAAIQAAETPPLEDLTEEEMNALAESMAAR